MFVIIGINVNKSSEKNQHSPSEEKPVSHSLFQQIGSFDENFQTTQCSLVRIDVFKAWDYEKETWL